MTKPNIVFIVTDQMRADCLGITGHPVVETPNLDEMARSGVVFTAAYSSCPSCIAARASMFTGLTPSSHGRLGYQDCVPWTYENTLPQLLGEAGYQTHCVGKTHFHPQRNHLGFHSMETYEGSQNFDGQFVNDYYEFLKEKSGGMHSEYGNGLGHNSWVTRPSQLPEELHNNTWVATKGIDFLRRRDKTRPFFLNLSFHRPHPPIDPPQAYWDMYRDAPLPVVPVGDWADRFDVPPAHTNAYCGHLPKATLDRARRAYYAQIAHIDNQIGRFRCELSQMKAGPTWFIFTSDHGEMLGDHHLFRKAYAYEGSAGIPFIVTPPAEGCGSISDAPVLLEDILPTCMEIAGVETPENVEGSSLVPLSKGNRPDDWRSFLHGEHSACYHSSLTMQYLTDGKEKYVWFTETGEEQFFNLTTDPQEMRNLAGCPEAEERVALWRKRMIERLATRPQDGLSDGERLIPGTLLPATRPELLPG
ncbi:MAG: arylsulfatase [Planctomycetota bacterium]|jgi:arylsulfatase A-like enzyme